jgi:hypothetical protein
MRPAASITLSASRRRAGRLDRGDAAAQHVDIGRLADGGFFAVEDARIAHHGQAGERMLQLGGGVGHLLLGGFWRWPAPARPLASPLPAYCRSPE